MNATEEFFIVLCVIIIVSLVIWYFKLYKKPTKIVKSPLETLLSVEFKDSQYILNPYSETIENYSVEYASDDWELGRHIDLKIEWKNGFGFTNAGVTGFVLKRRHVNDKDVETVINVSNDNTDKTKLVITDKSNLTKEERYNVKDDGNCAFIIYGIFIQNDVNVLGANFIEVSAIVGRDEILVGSTTIHINQDDFNLVPTLTKVARRRYVPILGGEKVSLKEKNGTYAITSGNKKCPFQIDTDSTGGVKDILVEGTRHPINLFKYTEEQVVIRNVDEKYLICEVTDTGLKTELRFVTYDYLNNKIKNSDITDFGFMTFTYEFEKDDTTTVEVTGVDLSTPEPAPPKFSCSARTPTECGADGMCKLIKFFGNDWCIDKPCVQRSVTPEVCTGKCSMSAKCKSGSRTGTECVDEGKQILNCPIPENCKTKWVPGEEFIAHCVEGNEVVTKLLSPEIKEVDTPASGGGNPCDGIGEKKWTVSHYWDYNPKCRLWKGCGLQCSSVVPGEIENIPRLKLKAYEESMSSRDRRYLKDFIAGTYSGLGGGAGVGSGVGVL